MSELFSTSNPLELFAEGDIPNEMKQSADALITYGIKNELLKVYLETEDSDRDADDENKISQQENKNK